MRPCDHASPRVKPLPQRRNYYQPATLSELSSGSTDPLAPEFMSPSPAVGDRSSSHSHEDDESMSLSPDDHSTYESSESDAGDDGSQHSQQSDTTSSCSTNSYRTRDRHSKSWKVLAIFGDSTFGLMVASLLFCGSLLTSLYPHVLEDTYSAVWTRIDSLPVWNTIAHHLSPLNPPKIWEWQDDWQSTGIPLEVKHAYERDGVVAVRGLLSSELLNRLNESSQVRIDNERARLSLKPRGPLTGQPSGGKQFFLVQEGAIFHDLLNSTRQAAGESADDSSCSTNALPPFVETALYSKIPILVEALLGHDTATNSNENNIQDTSSPNVRLLKDIFLAKDTDPYICGWHVDDTGFWPANADAPGINAWLALDTMPLEGGGGFALAVGSHKAVWKEEAYHVTGSTHTLPPEGFTSAADMVQRRAGKGTCNIATSAPHLHNQMEATKRIYEVELGDVILHHRWLFHRTVAFEGTESSSSRHDEVQQNKSNGSKRGKLYRRYSMRYGRGSARILKGYGTEPSVLWNPQNGGQSADDIDLQEGPWYPKTAVSRGDTEATMETQLSNLAVLAQTLWLDVQPQVNVRKQQLRQARRKASFTP